MIEPDQLTDPERKLWANVLLQAQSDISARDPTRAPRDAGFVRGTIPSAVSSGCAITCLWIPTPRANAS
jgi:hypothetical protein